LYPIHKYLFNLLKKIPQDGTFDQNKPFNDLIIGMKDLPLKLNGFDLSAATDRLPLDLQELILNRLNLKGSNWKALLDIEYKFKKEFIKYSVGQPMGAYSSFAMLAITHHVIVQVAAIKAGKSERFTSYCVLGDDIVIADEAVSQEYLNLMKTLGIKISTGKSICSSNFTEFAKRLKGLRQPVGFVPKGEYRTIKDPNDQRNLIIDYSPIGAGLILFVLRNRWSVCLLINDLLIRGLIPYWKVHQYISSLPKKYLRYKKLVYWVVAQYLRNLEIAGDPILEYWDAARSNQTLLEESSIKERLLEVKYEQLYKDVVRLFKSINYAFKVSIFRSTVGNRLPNWTELILFPFLPSFYLLIKSFMISFNDLTKCFGEWWLYKSMSLEEIESSISILDSLERVSLIDLSIKDKAKVKMTLTNLYLLNSIL